MNHVRSFPSRQIAPLAALRIAVSDVARRPGLMRRVEQPAVVPGLAAAGVGVPEGEPVDLDLRLEGVPGGVVVSGFVSGRWTAECSRCLEPVSGPLAAEVHELFETEPVESETYPLEGEEIDLEPLVRDAVLPGLPAPPLCADECLGLCPTCGADRNREQCRCPEPAAGARWAELDKLRFD